MNWINKLERRFGKYAINNLTMYIIGTYVIGYVFQYMSADLMGLFTLNPYRILHGEIWRLVTWLLVPPSNINIFTLIMLFFYYSLGTSLERTWGSFRYNLYIFSGILMTIVGAFVLYLVYAVNDSTAVIATAMYGSVDGFYNIKFSAFSTYYINLSIFLAFAASYPDMQILLYFVIPIKIKWLAYLDVAVLFIDVLKNIAANNWSVVVTIIISLLNFIVFFLSTRNYRRISPKEIHRRRSYSRQVHNVGGITKHKCAVCGRTEEDGENIDFRFCSKCNGNYEYCQDHLFTHEHIK